MSDARIRDWVTNTLGSHRRNGYLIENKQYLKFYLRWLASVTPNCSLCESPLMWDEPNQKLYEGPKWNSPTLDRVGNERTINDRNSWIICFRCNVTKSSMLPEDFVVHLERIVNNMRIRLIKGPASPPQDVSDKMKQDWGICVHCGKNYEVKKDGQSYCSGKCRHQAFLSRKYGYVTTNG